MAIFRGTGSASTTTDQATIDEVTTQATNAATSATNAASSASSASSSATSASSSASTATSQASAAATSASNAASSATDAQTAQTAAEAAQTAAETAETNIASAETNCSTSETNAINAKNDAESAQTAAEAAQAAAETAQTAAETAESNVDSTIASAIATATADAEAAQTAAEAAQSAAETAETNAETAQTAAETAQGLAETAQTNAETAETNAETAQASAEAALDEFTDLYLGVKSSAPTEDNDGDALQTGAIYYDSTDEQLYIWDGSAWDQAAFSVSGAVTSFNTRTGAVTLSSGDVTTALGYTPSQSGDNVSDFTNDAGYVVQSDIDTSISNLVDSAPATLDTLNELAAALGDDANFSTTVTNALGNKANSADLAAVATSGAYSDLSGTPSVIANVVDDTTPQLGGNLDLNSNDITGTGDIDITGTVTADGLTLDGEISLISTGNEGINFYDSSTSSSDLRYKLTNDITDNDSLKLFKYDSSGTFNGRALKIEANGDISFYEDTGATPKLFWDASAESLGIGTSSPSELLHIQGDGADLLITDAGGGQTAKIGSTGSNNGILELNNSSHTSTVFLNTSGDSYLNGGNVGIGTSSPSGKLHVSGTDIDLYLTGTRGSGHTYSINSSGTNAQDLQIFDVTANKRLYLLSTNIHAFYIDGSEKMRIDSSGNVGIGTSSPSATLTVESASDASIDLTGTSGSTQDVFIKFVAPDTGTAYIGIDDSEGLLKINNTSGLGGANHLLIDTSGNVGIGTSSPSQELDVVGTIAAARGLGATETASKTGTVTPDMDTYTNFVWTLTGNITLGNPGDEATGQSGVFIFIHSGAARTVSLSSDWETAGAAGLTLSGAAGAVDIVPYFVQSSGNILLGAPQLAFS